MRRRRVAIVVTDHAALRWLERVHGLDVAGLKAMLADKSRNGAELGATAVAIDGVRLVLEAHRDGGGRAVVTTVSPRHRGAKHPNRRGGDE